MASSLLFISYRADYLTKFSHLSISDVSIRLCLMHSGTVIKKLPTNAEDAQDSSLIPGSGRSPGVGNSNPRQYSCLGNLMDRGV